MKATRAAALLCALLLAGCDKFPHEDISAQNAWLANAGRFDADPKPSRDPGAERRERESSVGEYGRRPPGQF
jgi:hypothetical protein